MTKTLTFLILAAGSLYAYDRNAVISTVVMESSNDLREMQAIVSVIHNRAIHSRCDMDQVVSKRNQFAGYLRRDMARTPKFVKRWDLAARLVEQAESGKLEDNTHGCYNFRSYEHSGMKIGRQYFF